MNRDSEEQTIIYTYGEVIHRIQTARRFGKLTGKDTSMRMLELLGNPQKDIPFVHVAGTNGKGSTTAFLCRILEQTGRKIGMFTSPHLVEFEERIRINGAYIPKHEVTRIGNQLLAMEFGVEPTMFDYCLCMAVLYFKEQGCDLMVMETGLGGRCDSTNALATPMLSIITRIGYDHVAILGDTLSQIAWEKAGIMQPGIPVVVQRQEAEAEQVLREVYEELNSGVCVLAAESSAADKHAGVDDNPIAVRSTDETVEGYIRVRDLDIERVREYPMRMQGEYQLENAAAAMLAAEYILSQWLEKDAMCLHTPMQANISDGQPDGSIEERIERFIRAGIATTTWKGRMEILNEEPFFMVDGAHNSHGVHALAESLRILYPNEKFHFIMGVMADKDYEAMIEELLPLAIDFVTVTPESDRALQAEDLAACIQAKGVAATYAQDMESVIRPYLPDRDKVEKSQSYKSATTRLHGLQDLPQSRPQSTANKTVAFGSLYFVGAIEAYMERIL